MDATSTSRNENGSKKHEDSIAAEPTSVLHLRAVEAAPGAGWAPPGAMKQGAGHSSPPVLPITGAALPDRGYGPKPDGRSTREAEADVPIYDAPNLPEGQKPYMGQTSLSRGARGHDRLLWTDHKRR